MARNYDLFVLVPRLLKQGGLAYDLPGTFGNFADWNRVQALRETTIGLRCAPVAGSGVCPA